MAKAAAETKKIRYGKGEYGWVRAAGKDKWRVTNVPFFTKMDVNYDDVVTIRAVRDDFPRRDKVISRKYLYRHGIEYSPPTAPAYKKLFNFLEKHGSQPEGAVAGFVVLATNSSLAELKKILKELKGVKLLRVDQIQRYRKV